MMKGIYMEIASAKRTYLTYMGIMIFFALLTLFFDYYWIMNPSDPFIRKNILLYHLMSPGINFFGLPLGTAGVFLLRSYRQQAGFSRFNIYVILLFIILLFDLLMHTMKVQQTF